MARVEATREGSSVRPAQLFKSWAKVAINTIGAGDTVLIRPLTSQSISVGDVITYKNVAGQGMVTHRVVAIKEIKDRTYLQTKGDANDAPDPNLVPADAPYGKVALNLPKAGYLIHFASTLWGKLLLFGLPVVFLVAKEVQALLKMRTQHRGQERLLAPSEAQHGKASPC